MLRAAIRTTSFVLLVFLASTLFLSYSPPLLAGGQDNGKSQENPSMEARQLTGQFIALRGQYLHGNAAEHAAAYQALLDTAARRYESLGTLMQQSPAEVLSLSIPDAVRAGLPAAVQALMEKEDTLEGTLEVDYECGEQESRLLFGLQTKQERLSLHFAQEPAYLETGARVRVHGVRLGLEMALSSADDASSFQELAPALPNTFGEQKTAVILVNFQNAPTQPYTLEHARDVVFSTTSDFDMENSQSQTWLTGDVFGWYTIPVNNNVCDTTSIESYAKQAAAAAGADLTAYRRFVFGFPQNACSWWGLGTVGGNPSRAFINGSFTLKVVGHEMGHNFGLYHSRTATNEYGDTLDIMGNPSSDHFNAFQKERLGWLNYQGQPPITTVATSGDFFIDPYAASSGNPKALKILKETDASTGKNTWYYVEHRRNIGFDSGIGGNSNVLNGVVVHTGSESTGNSSFLLDMTPETGTFSDPALVVGDSFSDPAAGITITTVSTSSSGASVHVGFGSTSCVPAAPTLTPDSAQTPYGDAGSTLSYALTLKNNDSAGCTSTVFNTGTALPAGWTSAVNPASVALNPGATVSIIVQVTSAASAPEGLYDIIVGSASGADPGKTASAQVNYGVSSPAVCVSGNPALTVIPPVSQSAAAGSSLSFALELNNNDSAACGSTVFNLSANPPSGWSASFVPATASLAPGTSVSINVTTTSTADAAGSTYTIPLKATSSTDAAKTASATVMHVVTGPLSVALSTSKAEYNPGEKVSVTAEVTDGGSSVAGATIDFTVTDPDGGSTSKSVSTSSNGTAVYTFQLSRKETAGTFQVSAAASSGSNSGEATTSFSVTAGSSGSGSNPGKGPHKK